MSKISTGSTVSYGTVLPATDKTADGSLFFLTSAYSDPAGSVTNSTFAAISREPGLHVYSFQQDFNSAVPGDQVGQGWKQLTTLKDYLDATGGTVTGDLILQSAGTYHGVRLLNVNGDGGGAISAIQSTAGGLSFSSDSGPMSFVTSGTTRLTISANGAATLNGGTIWTSTNDGTGSGLDADLLDGQDSSFFLNAANQTGTVSVARGGTGSTSTIAGGVLYGSSTSQITTTPAGTAAQLLQSGGAAAPSWVTPTSLIVGSALLLKNNADPAGQSMKFTYAGQSGSPSYLWGSNDGANHLVWPTAGLTVGQAANATTLGGFPPSTSAAGNSIAARDSGGSIYGAYFVGNSANSEGGTISQIIVTNGSDNLFRKASVAQLKSSFNLGGTYVAKAGDTMSGPLYINGITLDWASSSITASGAITTNTLTSNGGLNVGGNANVGGTVTAGAFATVNLVYAGGVTLSGGNSGYLTLNRGGANSGYMEFVAQNGNRQGYIGNSNTGGSTDTGTITFAMGQANFSGEVVAYASDARLKTNVTIIPNAMEKIATLGGYEYDWDMEKTRRLGFYPRNTHEHGLLAQEVQKVMPDAVCPAPFNEDYLTVKYERIISLLVAGMNELQEQVNSLMAEVEELKGQ